MNFKLRMLLPLFLVVISFIQVGCAVSPLGRRQIKLMPAGQMDAMGIQAFNEMKLKAPQDKNPQMNSYIRCVANALLDVLPEETGAISAEGWEIVVFDDKTANAFALPGKKIGVHSGILPVAHTPDALAAVIGHEIGHVIAGHGNERVSEAFIAQGGLAVVGSILKDKESPRYNLLMGALGLGAQFGVLLPHSRTQESEADIIGLRLMARAGFNPDDSVTLWQNMEKTSGTSGPEFLSTHPAHGTRIENLRKNIPLVSSFYLERKAKNTLPHCSYRN